MIAAESGKCHGERFSIKKRVSFTFPNPTQLLGPFCPQRHPGISLHPMLLYSQWPKIISLVSILSSSQPFLPYSYLRFSYFKPTDSRNVACSYPYRRPSHQRLSSRRRRRRHLPCVRYRMHLQQQQDTSCPATSVLESIQSSIRWLFFFYYLICISFSSQAFSSPTQNQTHCAPEIPWQHQIYIGIRQIKKQSTDDIRFRSRRRIVSQYYPLRHPFTSFLQTSGSSPQDWCCRCKAGCESQACHQQKVDFASPISFPALYFQKYCRPQARKKFWVGAEATPQGETCRL